MSQMIIRESSDGMNSQDRGPSSDDNHSDWQQDNMDYATKMIKSSDRVDKRLIDLYMLKRADQAGLHLGFNNEVISKSYARRRATINNLEKSFNVSQVKKDRQTSLRRQQTYR